MIKVQITDVDALSSIPAARLRDYLLTNGWNDEGGWSDRDATLFTKKSGGERRSIIVPDTESPYGDYASLMANALSVLADVENRSQLEIFRDVKNPELDVVREIEERLGMTNWIEYVVSTLRGAGHADALRELVARIDADAETAVKRGDDKAARLLQRTSKKFIREIARYDFPALLKNLKESASEHYPGDDSMTAAIERFAAQVEGREVPPMPQPTEPGFLARIAEEYLRENSADSDKD